MSEPAEERSAREPDPADGRAPSAEPEVRMPVAADPATGTAGDLAAPAEDRPATGPSVPVPAPHTGDRAVDEALESLSDLAGRPTTDQVEVYVGVHRRLQDRLADLDG